MRFFVQCKEEITAENKEGTKKCKVNPHILKNKEKLKKPEEIQSMRWIDKLKIPSPRYWLILLRT
jgi:hypothetical protein